jgi:hypothetical protein
MDTVKHHFSIAKSLAHFLDEQFKIGGLTFGVDPLLDFIPGIGDFFGLVLSLYIIWIAKQVQIPEKEITHMVFNVIFDFLIGLIPFLGIVGDVAFKANMKNIRILEKYMNEKSPAVVEAEIVSR